MPNGQAVQDQRATKAAQISQMRPEATPQLPMVDPARAAMTAGLAPQVLPPSNPVADPYQIASEQLQRERATAERLTPLFAEQQAMTQPRSPANPDGIPKMGLSDETWMKMQPITGQGFGHDAGNVVGDIGRALLTFLASTGPGRAVQDTVYGPGERRYAAKKAAVAQQIADIQKQEELEERPIGPMGELAYHQELIGTKEEQNRIRQQLADEKTQVDADKTDIERQKLELARQRADQAVQKWRQQFGVQLKNVQLRAKNLDRETARDQMDAMLRDQANQNFAARTAAGQGEKEAQLATAADIAQAKIDSDKWLQRTFGIQPKIPPRQNISAGGAGGGGGQGAVKVTDPRGVVHTFPDQNSANNFKRAAGIK